MKWIKCVVILPLSFLFFHCGDPVSVHEYPYIFYFNSFESPRDTVGWHGYATIRRDEDAPPNGGKYSLYVSGGCFVPHAVFEFPALSRDAHIVLQAWGKNLGIGGGISIGYYISDDYRGEYVSIFVDDPQWRLYEAPDTLFVPARTKWSLSIGAGGIAPSAILVDEIKVIRVK